MPLKPIFSEILLFQSTIFQTSRVGEPGIGLEKNIKTKYIIDQHIYADILGSGDRIYKKVVSIWHTIEQRRENMHNKHFGRAISQKILVLEALFNSKV